MEEEKAMAIEQQGQQNAQLQQMKGEQEAALLQKEMDMIVLKGQQERETLVLKYEKEMQLRFGIEKIKGDQKENEKIVDTITEQEKEKELK